MHLCVVRVLYGDTCEVFTHVEVKAKLQQICIKTMWREKKGGRVGAGA